MKNKKFHIIMTENNHRHIKALAATKGLTIGQTIKAMLDFYNSEKYFNDAKFQERFENLRDLAFFNSETEGGWSAEDGFDMKKLHEEFDRQAVL